ncbi:aldehyde dehydrogenase family protein [Sphingomonas bacterium]|uniref:aldehyde dehydrogenase family protein n=1 Tax=Sphingomonas bacterium TaxID=1895847 RepID=UPI0015764E6E|nr:aldehyde dehydrogenase family protein [Sphingomonas bacterium]
MSRDDPEKAGTTAASAPTINPAALAYVKAGPKQLYIDGKWTAAKSGETFDVIDPSTADVMVAVATGDAADIDLAVAAARKAFRDPSWARISPHQRSRYLLTIADIIERNADELAVIQAIDIGMVLAQSRGLIATMPDVFRYFAGAATKVMGSTYPSDGSSLTYTLREPLGVVGAIIPWNSPAFAFAWKVAPALACGNTVVLKPAEQAPLLPLRLAELIEEADLPPGVLNIVPGLGAGAGDALAKHPGVNKINFTGSTGVGKGILAASTGNLKKVTLELGGKSPNIIFPDADLSKAIPAALMGFAAGAGQICVAGTRIFVHEDVYGEVAAAIAQAAQGMKTGNPLDPGTDVGPIISQKQFDRVSDYIKVGQDEGATLRTGGQAHAGSGYFVQPTVFEDVTDQMRIVREEIFGPVAALIPFKDENDAVFRANDTEFGLAAAVWTKDISRAHTVARALEAGTVWINTIYELDVMVPYGGYKMSGIGRELGPESIEANTQLKTVVARF